jgi:hypothetical protein
MVLPLLGGEGRGEDERKTNFRRVDSLALPGLERLASRCKTTNLPA